MTPAAPSSLPVGVLAGVVSVVMVVLFLVIAIIITMIICFWHKRNHLYSSGFPSCHRRKKCTASNDIDLKEAGGADNYTYSIVTKKAPKIPSQNSTKQEIKDTQDTSHNLEWSQETSPKLAKVTRTKGLILESNPLYQKADQEKISHLTISEPFYAVPEGGDTADGVPVPIYSVPLAPDQLDYSQQPDSDVDTLISPIYAKPDLTKKHYHPLEISHDNIQEVRELGLGQFGKVVLAETIGLSLKDLQLSTSDDDKSKGVLVAVKKLRADVEPSSKEAFKKEMRFMSQLNHSNVLRLLAVNDSAEPFMVMEYIENGDLHQFLQKIEFTSTHPPSSNKLISTPILLHMAVQIADGMAYLASHNFIHRDLAARNILVGGNHNVKVSDFGLSRSLYESAYYRAKGKARMPVRWMSWECYYGKFSEKSDVWAYGVTVWEIFTLARHPPYYQMTDMEVVNDALKAAERIILEKPEFCPDEVYEVLQSMCWAPEHRERASFKDIYYTLDALRDEQ